jgi:hypothetical protein
MIKKHWRKIVKI